MSIRIMSAVWQTPCDSGTEKLVFLALADNANDAGVCWPSIQTIAKKVDITPRSVVNAIHALEKRGLLGVRRATGRPNGYTLKPVNVVHQCSSFTSESLSLPPVNVVHGTREGDSLPPVNVVHPNRKENRKEPSSEPKRRPKAPAAEPLPLPFSSPEFAEAWQDWKTHRKEIKKPVTPTSEKASLAKCAEWGEPRALAAIRHTIANGWQGIREPDQKSNGSHPAAPRKVNRNIGTSNNPSEYAGIHNIGGNRKDP